MKKNALLFLGLLLLTVSAKAETIGWNFTDLNSTFDLGTPIGFTLTDFTAVAATFAAVNATSPSTGTGTYPGASGGGNSVVSAVGGGFDLGTSTYYTITVTPGAGGAITVSNFDFGTRSTATGPQAFSLRSSVDAFAADIVTGTIASDSAWAFKDTSFSSISGLTDTALEIRLYLYSGTGTAVTGNNRIDDLSIDVTSSAVPEPGVITLLGLGFGILVWRTARRRVSA